MQGSLDSIADRADAAQPLGPSALAALSLLAANAGMLFLYFWLELTLFELVVVYWFEALWVGLFSGLKLLTASLFGDPFENRWVDVSAGVSILLSLFAIAKSGVAFLFLISVTFVALVVAQQELTGIDGTQFVKGQLPMLLKCSLIFLAGHGLSFVINFLALGEYRRARFVTLLWLPFKRAIALFVTIVAALYAMRQWPGVLTYTSFAAVLIVVKLGWDLLLHWMERRSFKAAENPS
jgi:hypothetical protein